MKTKSYSTTRKILWPLLAIFLTLKDIGSAVGKTKSYWLLPIIIFLLALGVAGLLISLSGPLAPFIYPIL